MKPNADPPKAAKKKLILSLILLAGGILYAVFPMDLIPDVLGPVGWIDDVGFLLVACLNAAYTYYRTKNKKNIDQ